MTSGSQFCIFQKIPPPQLLGHIVYANIARPLDERERVHGYRYIYARAARPAKAISQTLEFSYKSCQSTGLFISDNHPSDADPSGTGLALVLNISLGVLFKNTGLADTHNGTSIKLHNCKCLIPLDASHAAPRCSCICVNALEIRMFRVLWACAR